LDVYLIALDALDDLGETVVMRAPRDLRQTLPHVRLALPDAM
jgi:hypothetical protein